MDTEGNVSKTNSSELWVEKYKPTSYMDLLSDEVYVVPLYRVIIFIFFISFSWISFV